MLHIANKTRKRIPIVLFQEIKDFALGQGYELSLVFVGDKISKLINEKYRGKNEPTNILSFPYSENEGEILIDLNIVSKEAVVLGQKVSSYLMYIFIHGLMHLKGFDHGSRMEAAEEKIRIKFSEK
ncbi:MAG: rRNA maturation RNase YbeY [Candidatus Vogelbacteria bacterium]|nr:rRNA maturation RNase YbeY [Candidatus Vogelbacteria bacterium]